MFDQDELNSMPSGGDGGGDPAGPALGFFFLLGIAVACAFALGLFS